MVRLLSARACLKNCFPSAVRLQAACFGTIWLNLKLWRIRGENGTYPEPRVHRRWNHFFQRGADRSAGTYASRFLPVRPSIIPIIPSIGSMIMLLLCQRNPDETAAATARSDRGQKHAFNWLTVSVSALSAMLLCYSHTVSGNGPWPPVLRMPVSGLRHGWRRGGRGSEVSSSGRTAILPSSVSTRAPLNGPADQIETGDGHALLKEERLPTSRQFPEASG